jgi:hypothetical protein
VIPFWLGARAMRNSSVGCPVVTTCHDIPLFVILEKPVSLPILEALLQELVAFGQTAVFSFCTIFFSEGRFR